MNEERSLTAKHARGPALGKALLEDVAEGLLAGALPGELEGWGDQDRREAARFILTAARERHPGHPMVQLESVGGAVGERRMRLVVVNDDMPFLVDSVAGAIGARGLQIHRLLHPIFCVERSARGVLQAIKPQCDDRPRRESFLYVEIDRAPASTRRALSAEIERVLGDVRAAVEDWPQLQARLHADADRLKNEEAAALLHWFADGAMTLLGFYVVRQGTKPSQALGILRRPGDPVWDEASCADGIAYFQRGGAVPLLAKADRPSTVHRRALFDVIVLPVWDGEVIDGLAFYAGLWTSQALRAPPEEVPILRRRLAAQQEAGGFDPQSHTGKSLRHAIGTLPHDLLVSLRPQSIARLAATAMSVVDRPRPAVELLHSILKGHLFAFVWLPREQLTTHRQQAIGAMLEQASGGRISNWSVELSESDLALLRFTLDVDPAVPLPNAAELTDQLDTMLRGWEPNVEEALASLVGGARAIRLGLTIVARFPEDYRNRTEPAEAAQDVLRLAELRDPDQRNARLLTRTDDEPGRVRLKTYRHGASIALSEAVPVFENFGFRVLEEWPTRLIDGSYIHEFLLESDAEDVQQRAPVIERAVAAVLEGKAENDAFNQLLVGAGLAPDALVLLRAWFRYLRQTGLSYGLGTVSEALRKAPDVAQALIVLFRALHDPALQKDRETCVSEAQAQIDEGLTLVAAIDEDRILRLLRSVVLACLRTNAFVPAGSEALAFKIDSAAVPGLPVPVPWREIWVYSPRVEGIHLRSGPVARGGIRWSDRRDDFRTEILGLMKAQVVKNAVIVPTGAKGGFYPKHLPAPAQREAWLAEGTEAYRIFIRALLSVTDNLVGGKVVHPKGMVVRDGNDPYFVVAADKGTASFSDVANAIALERGYWLGDAFASGGSQGYDHKAIGITARGAWISVRRHFAEMGVDIQSQPVRAVGCGDMSGDVFGNGMLLSRAIRLVAAFDHRHIFIDPDPDPAASWTERQRLFALPRSSWDDYDKKLISRGGGVFPRSQKAIPLSAEIKALIGVADDALDPASLVRALLKAPIDLLWFGGIGTFIKGSAQNHVEVGDPANDSLRVDAAELRTKVIGEGANLAITQAARIEFALGGGRINTDFIDNSAGVDCSDHEVNIKIPLNREMTEQRLTPAKRNKLLIDMTQEVAELVLEDNRLQTLALSTAERGGASALPQLVRAIEVLEESGRLNRRVEGLANNQELLRRAQENQGLTRPELAVLLSTAKIALQVAIEASPLADDPMLDDELTAYFPPKMRKSHRKAIAQHPLRREILATGVANRLVNRLGILAPFALTEEQGGSWAQAASAFVATERLFDMAALWSDIDRLDCTEDVRLALFEQSAAGLQLHISDLMRAADPSKSAGELVAQLRPGLKKLDRAREQLLLAEPRKQVDALVDMLVTLGAPAAIVQRVVRLFKLDGAIGIAALGQRLGCDEISLTRAYTRLGEALGLDWAQSAANRLAPREPWERLLAASLGRDFEQLRLDFLARSRKSNPEAQVERWLAGQTARIDQFRRLVQRARGASAPTLPMLAEIAAQARILLAR